MQEVRAILNKMEVIDSDGLQWEGGGCDKCCEYRRDKSFLRKRLARAENIPVISVTFRCALTSSSFVVRVSTFWKAASSELPATGES